MLLPACPLPLTPYHSEGLSKIEAGIIDPYIEDFDLFEVITEATEFMSKQIEEKGVVLTFDLVHQMMHTDKGRLLQCLLKMKDAVL